MPAEVQTIVRMPTKTRTIFSLPYAGSLRFYALWLKTEMPELEAFEYYEKQSFRSRCLIAGPNGTLVLTIPIRREARGQGKRLYPKVCIAYDENWSKRHFQSLETVYRRSPYFEFYELELRSIFEAKTQYLFDFNMNLHLWILDKLQISKKFELTDHFVTDTPMMDYRYLSSKKKPKMDGACLEPNYLSQFPLPKGSRWDLSIFDLLFAMGPETQTILSQCQK